MQTLILRTWVAILFCCLTFPSVLAQNVGIFQTYVVYDLDGGGNTFRAGGINSDLAPVFNGLNLGTPTSLILNGGEVKTFKNGGGDVLGAILHYRVYEQSATPPSFTALNLPFESNLANPGDQRWQEVGAGVDVLAGGSLPAGNYILEVFWEASTNQGAQFDSDFGNNFQATFTVAAPPATVPTLSEWGLIILALTTLIVGTVSIRKLQLG